MDTNPFEHCALLVLDMQAPFVEAVQENESLVRRIGLALDAAKLMGLRAFATEQVPGKLGPTIPPLRTRLDPERIFPKTAFSALAAEGVPELLDAWEVEHLLITGIETPICVYQTVLAALADDRDVTVLSDAVGARRPADADAARRMLSENGCHWLPVETVFYSMLEDAEDPRFREFSKLVKEHA